MPEILLTHVSVMAGNLHLLEGASFHIEHQATTLVIGSSGSGKTTFLKAAAGLLDYQSGSIVRGESDLRSFNREKTLEMHKNTGFMFQDAALWANKSIGYNLALPLRVKWPKIAKGEIDDRIERAVHSVGFKGELDLRPSTLSTGEMKLISFLRAVITDPDIIFLDEPLASLDRRKGEKLLSYMEFLKEKKKTMVIVSHNSELTARLADNMVLLHQGRVVKSGKYKEVFFSADPVVKEILYDAVEGESSK